MLYSDGMRVGIDSLLSSISAFSKDLNKLHTVYSGILERMKPLVQPVGQCAELNFESTGTGKFEPLPVTWQSLFQKTIESLTAK